MLKDEIQELIRAEIAAARQVEPCSAVAPHDNLVWDRGARTYTCRTCGKMYAKDNNGGLRDYGA